MFHSGSLPALTRHQCITPLGAQPRTLTAIKGTRTPIYVLKLSSDPSITKVPGRLGFPSDPWCLSTPSAAYTRGLCHAVLFSNVPEYGFSPFHKLAGSMRITTPPVSVSPNPAMDWVERGLSPSSARCSRTSQNYPACSYGGLRRFGESSRKVPLSVCLQSGGLLTEPSSMSVKIHRASRHACEPPRPSPVSWPCINIVPTNV